MKDYTAFFENFGYETERGCDICGAKPAQVEPRFLYATCKKHCMLSPVTFSYVRDGIEPDPTENHEN